MMKGKCTVCTGKCDHTKHVKEEKINEIKTRRVKRTKEDLKKKYEKEFGETKCVMIKLEEEMEMEAEKWRLVEECYQCLEKLIKMALKSTSISSLRHLDFMTEKAKESGKQKRVQNPEDLKRRTDWKITLWLFYIDKCHFTKHSTNY